MGLPARVLKYKQVVQVDKMKQWQQNNGVQKDLIGSDDKSMMNSEIESAMDQISRMAFKYGVTVAQHSTFVVLTLHLRILQKN